MKKRNILFTLGLGLLCCTSCDNDGDRVGIDESQFEKPVFTQKIQQDFTVTEATLKDEIGTWSWTKANFGIESPAKYEIEVDTLENFATAKVLTTATDTKLEVTQETVNKGATLFFDEAKKISLYFRVKSSLGTVASGPVFYSNVEKLQFTFLFVKDLPLDMYMIGGDFGEWNWDNESLVKMIPVNSVDGAFWTIQYFKKGNGFKWAPEKDWKDAYGKLKTNTGFSWDNDGNGVVAKDGLYMVYIDFESGKIAIEEPKVYGIGGAFGDFAAGEYPFVMDGDKMTIEVKNNDDLRMYAESSIATSDWWTREFIIRGGKIEYRGRGGDQEPRVKVKAGQKVTLDFRTGTGNIK